MKQRGSAPPRRGPVPVSGRPGKVSVFAWVAGIAVLGLGFAHIRYLWFVCDDAFISFRYGANLARGLGLVYNPGERVEGYSNFLWTLLSGAMITLGGRPEAWTPVVSAGCALATLALVMVAAHRSGANPIWAGGFLAASSAFAGWATGGLETALYTLLVTAGFLAVASALPAAASALPAVASALPAVASRRPWLGAWLLGLAALARPDGALVGLTTAAFLLALVARRTLPARVWLIGAAIWLACVLPHLFWRLAFYGRLLPNSFAVKTPGLERVAKGGLYVAVAFRDLHLYLLLVPLAAAFALRAGRAWKTRGWRLGVTIVVPYLVYVASTGGDFMPLYRFVAPLVPILALGAGIALDDLARGIASRGSRPVAIACASLVMIAFAFLNLRGSRHEQEVWTKGHIASVGLAREETANWTRVGLLLRLLSEPTDTLATTAAGIIPYVTGLHTIDLFGLSAADLSRYRRLDFDRPGHTQIMAGRWLEERPPQILLGHPLVLDAPDHLGLSLELEPAWRPRILEHYEFTGLALPGEPKRYVGCAFRKDIVPRVAAAGRRLSTPSR